MREDSIYKSMKKVEIYTKPGCPFCIRAKHLLVEKNVEYIEHDVSDPTQQEVMTARSNGRSTVPQIFIEGEHIGGCDDLYALESAGKLNKKLGL